MKIDRTKLVVSAALLAVLAVGADAWVGSRQDAQGGDGVDGSSFAGGPGTRSAFHRFTLPFAQSITGFANLTTETMVKVVNDSDQSVEVTIEWYYAFGGLAGTSGTTSILSHQSNLLSTSNPTEDTLPFLQSSGFRDSTGDFSGWGRVMIGPNSGSAKNVTVQAVLLTDMDGGKTGSFGTNARTVSELRVQRADDADGDGSTDSRFKGD